METKLEIRQPLKPTQSWVVDVSTLTGGVLPAIADASTDVVYLDGGTYYRKATATITAYDNPTDVEFPFGNGIEIIDFVYTITRMGKAPTITATFHSYENYDALWEMEMFVMMNGEKFYLKDKPSFSRENTDARYKYDAMFVSERAVLENVYFYDVVSPYYQLKPISESSVFSFFGDIDDLRVRINASLVKSGLAKIKIRHDVIYNNSTYYQYPYANMITYDEWVAWGNGTTPSGKTTSRGSITNFYTYYGGDYEAYLWGELYFTRAEWEILGGGDISNQLWKPKGDPYLIRLQTSDYLHYHANIYDHYDGDYDAYLFGEVYQKVPNREPAEPLLEGYYVEIGTDEFGNTTQSDEVLLTFENNTIYEALQKIKDDFELYYYIVKDPLTGDTVITIGDHEYEFASDEPFSYGSTNELLSFEKTKEDTDIVTKCTGYGSEDNIPWYYPNPTADGWLVPVYKRGNGRNGQEQEVLWPIYFPIDYPTTEGTTTEEQKRYERYLKNRLGKSFVFGKLIQTIGAYNYIGRKEGQQRLSSYNESTKTLTLAYTFTLTEECWVEFNFQNLWDTDVVDTSISIRKNSGVGSNKVMYQGEYEIFLKANNAGSTSIRTYYAYHAVGHSEYSTPTDIRQNNRLRAGTYNLNFIFKYQNLAYYVKPATVLYNNETNIDNGYKNTAFYYPAKSFLWTVKKTCPDYYALQMISPLAWSDDNLKDEHGTMYPPFFSSIPNLVFKDGDDDAYWAGWYEQGASQPIDILNDSRIVIPQPDTTYYAFLHTTGTVNTSADKIYRVEFRQHKKGCVCHLTGDDWDAGAQHDIWYEWAYGSGGNHSYYEPYKEEYAFCNDVDSFISAGLFKLDINIYKLAWTRDKKIVSLADYGITNETQITNFPARGLDEICFRRVKWVTPSKFLMPELWYRTDGLRRFYEAKNYYLTNGSNDTDAGESLDTSTTPNQTNNELYRNPNSTDASNNYHYRFENVFNPNFPLEHIEQLERIKPTITEMWNFIRLKSKPSDWDEGDGYKNYYRKNTTTGEYEQITDSTKPPFGIYSVFYAKIRIDIVEEFAYDELDDNDIWENNDKDGNVSGEYKHPHFFAKLRPLGFNLFDLALEGGGDMELSLTTGNCGACVFKIKVDENTKKNPVQIWEYDVYKKSGGEIVGSGGSNVPETYTKVYDKGSLRRYVDNTNLYYLTDPNTYTPINNWALLRTSQNITMIETEDNVTSVFDLTAMVSKNRGYTTSVYDSQAVINGEVGCLNSEAKKHFAGDVVTSGKFNTDQQDTSENYVWVALEKDINTYGVPMPFAQPNIAGFAYQKYIRPLAIADVHIPSTNPITGASQRESTIAEDEALADKFVLTNIRLPQRYLRQAEHKLSVAIVKYMFENNYRKYNFGIKFSRIYFAQNPSIVAHINENAVLHIDYDSAENIRQYVSQFTYTKKANEILPEINVSLVNDLTTTESKNKRAQRKLKEDAQKQRVLSEVSSKITDVVSKGYDDGVINIV